MAAPIITSASCTAGLVFESTWVTDVSLSGNLMRAISDWLPLTNAVELVRPLFMDQWPQQPLRHGVVLAATTVVAFWLALALTRRRFRG
jgi:uncharacterized phage infection (PIP) family protein YhgE